MRFGRQNVKGVKRVTMQCTCNDHRERGVKSSRMSYGSVSWRREEMTRYDNDSDDERKDDTMR